MIINFLLVIYFALVLFCVIDRIYLTKKVMSDSFMSKETTDTLRGISILAIAFSHICQAESTLKSILVGAKHTYMFVFSWGDVE